MNDTSNKMIEIFYHHERQLIGRIGKSVIQRMNELFLLILEKEVINQ